MNLANCPRVEKNAGTDTIEFVFHIDKPNIRRATYVRSVCDIRPQKTETRRTNLTLGENIIDFPGEVSMPTSYLTTKKYILTATSQMSNKGTCA